MSWFNNLKLSVKLFFSILISCALGVLIGYKINDLISNVSIMSFILIIVGILLTIITFRVMAENLSKPIKKICSLVNGLSEGDSNIAFNGARDDEIGLIEKSLLVLHQNMKLLAGKVSEAGKAVENGEMNVKIDESQFSGLWMHIADSYNKSIFTITNLIKEAHQVMSKMAYNDYTLNVCGSYKGDMQKFADDINTVHTRLLSVQDAFVRVSKGDTSRLAEFKKIIKRSENDMLMPAMIAINESIENIIKEAEIVTKSAIEGNLEVRADLGKFEGGYRKIVEGINKTIDIMEEPLDASLKVLGRLSLNDFTTRMDGKYKGIFNDFANAINNVQSHLIHVQEIVIKIADGDVSELESLKKTGKRSDNDRLAPSFISMAETINDLIIEVTMLSREAVDGRLDTRGKAEKFKGGYMEIIKGLNNTLDAVIQPIKEASAVLSEVAKGNLQVSVTGNYKGGHAEIKNALNTTISILHTYIEEISKVLNEISGGNLDVSISGDYKGNFVEIKNSLNKIIKSLNEIFSEMNSASEQVASGSRQISLSSQSLSQGATEQASSIEEITSSITQIAAQTKQNALNAGQANELGISAKNSATLGNEQMKNMLKAMAEVNESSSNISKIIKVIDEIAFQTNILALNAAVEAARAGQYGKGFAVVAEEVRNLAARSAKAAKETTDLIEGSVLKVEAGTKIANETAGALNKIVDDVTKVANLVGNIASASNEQATGISQVDQAISQVSDVVQTNSATSQESAAASEELSGQAEMLKGMVGKLKLKKSDISINSYEHLSPDLINAFESMIEEKKSKKQHLGGTAENETTAIAGKSSPSKIKLSFNDSEFGKY